MTPHGPSGAGTATFSGSVGPRDPAQPAVAIGGGYAASVLYGAGDPDTRAKAWSELGDVPLDIAERELP